MFEEIKQTLENKFKCKVIRRPREYFDDIIVTNIPRGDKSKIMLYIKMNYKKYMSIRVNMDDVLIYFYFVTTQEKIDNVKKQIQIDKTRFKWLYEKIKEEDVYVKRGIPDTKRN